MTTDRYKRPRATTYDTKRGVVINEAVEVLRIHRRTIYEWLSNDAISLDDLRQLVATYRDQRLLTVPEACDVMGCSRKQVYKMYYAGELKLVHIQDTLRVPSAEAVRYVRERSSAYANPELAETLLR